MIYLVTTSLQLFDNPAYKIITPEESLTLMKDWKVIQVDSETDGLNCHINKVLCFQFGNKNADNQIVVDCSTVDLKLYKQLLENNLLIFHNAKFDLQFLYNYRIVPLNVYDTMIAEQTLYQGCPHQVIYKSTYDKEGYTFPVVSDPEKPYLYTTSYSLKAVTNKYIHKDRDKSIRSEISTRGLDDSVILYAAADVVDLEDIREAQLIHAAELGCTKAIELECGFIPSLAYTEWCGVKLDATKWQAKMDKDKANLAAAEKVLNDYVCHNDKLKKFTYIDMQGNLFTGFDSEPKCTVSWASSKQVIPVFKALGFDTNTQDKKTGEDKDSVLEKVLSIQKGINDEFLKDYFNYQEYAKVVSSFGQGHLDAINPITGRIHTKFNQFGATSGRLSCGGGEDNDLCTYKKLPAHSCKLLNLQQLPHDPETRACFVAEPGNLWVSCDFSAEEARLTADVSGDPEYYKEFTERTGDTHAMFAWACYEKECRALGCESAMDVKKKAKVWRDKVKSAEFAYTFSASAPTIAKTAGIPVEQAEQMVTTLDQFFAGLTTFKQVAAQKVKRLGYIEICPETGHRLTWWDHKKWVEAQKSYTREFWDEYKLHHKGTGDAIATEVRQHFQAADKYGKLGLNSLTQGRGAIIFKQACTDLFKWILTNGYFNKVKICVGVHDEINCEFPKELTTFPNVLQTTMENAAAMYCHTLKIPAEPSVGDHWIH